MPTALDPPSASVGLTWQPAWLSYVGSVTTCLRALGVECDPTEVAGASGYAFAISINEGLCPSGPTCLEWNLLSQGVSDLGRSTTTYYAQECYVKHTRNDRTRAHAREAFALAKRETDAGRPCVVWGLGVAEFGVVRGTEGDEYLCVKGGPTPARVRWDEVDAPGGPFCLAFPTAREIDADQAARLALWRAVMMTRRPDYAARWTTQLNAYDFWIQELRARHAVRWSTSYNAQCWAEARQHAAGYTHGLASRLPGAADALGAAHEAYRVVADHLKVVAEAFSWDHDFDLSVVDDPSVIDHAAEHLAAARDAEARAALALQAALAVLNAG